MPAELTPGDLDQIREALKLGSRIYAVRLYRERTGAGLAEATRFIDDLVLTTQALSTPSPELLERVVALVTRGVDDAPSSAEQERLTREYPEAHLIAAFAQARALSNAAYRLCDAHREGKLGYDAVLTRLAEECPGFTPAAYEAARSAGLRDTR